MKRYALVSNADSRHQLEAYLPDNYEIIGEFDEADPVFLDSDRLVGREGRPVFVIEGEDAFGWTFNGYVEPRLASGLIHANEVGLDHPVMKLIPMTEPRVKKVLYEFSLTCGHEAEVEVDEKYMPKNGIYVCPECGAEEAVPIA